MVTAAQAVKIDSKELARRIGQNPLSFLDATYDSGFVIGDEERHAAQLAAVRQRFETLRPRLPPLAKLAVDQGIESISGFADLAALLFPHTVYKSYPFSFIEQGRFDRLSRWFSSLTTVSLAAIDTQGIATIDDWIAALERDTPLAPIHTFGTSGKLSFLPRTREQVRITVTLNARCVRDFDGAYAGPDLLIDHRPLIAPSYRRGASAIARGMNLMAELYGGGTALFLYPETLFSADVLSLAGRLRAAETRGEAGRLELPAALQARRQEFAQREANRPQDLDRFFTEAASRFAGREVFLFAVWPILFEWADEGLKRGLKGIFGPNSILTSGGGSKGRPLPPDHRERIAEFLGFTRTLEFFGMSELMANAPRCQVGNYHFPPVVIPFVLDGDTGQMLPREGLQTGRLALMDLLPDSYWGGLVTGDQVTLGGFGTPCDCGRRGPYLRPEISRYSELKNGDDKINCAGAPEAHDRAIEFLLDRSGA